MKKLMGVILFFLILMVLSRGSCRAEEPKLFVHYHLWYSNDEPYKGWNRSWTGWSQKESVIGGVDPTNFISPWRRVTKSRVGLPIYGPYSSWNLDIVRYQFRIAKQAGVDGMFAAIYDGVMWPLFHQHLRVANEEGMKLGIELYGGIPDGPRLKGMENDKYVYVPNRADGCVIRRSFSKDILTNYLNWYKDSPAFLRIDGRPVIWIANGSRKLKQIWPTSDCDDRLVYSWGNVEELSKLINEVESNIGEKIYLVMTGPAVDNLGGKFKGMDSIFKITRGSPNVFAFWNKFGEDRQISSQLSPSDRVKYESELQRVVDLGQAEVGEKQGLDTGSGFDERGLFPTNEDRFSGINLPRAVINRRGNGMYTEPEGFLKASLEIAKRNGLWVFLNSWNDWQEQHQIEPGFNFANFSEHMDFFAPLRRVAEFKGLNEVVFELPKPELLDPPLISSCRYKQLEGGKVKLRGSFKALGKLTLSYLDDDLSYQDPSYLPATKWRELIGVVNSTSEERSFEIDLTPVLDKPGIAFGVDVLPGNRLGEIWVNELKLDWYGQEVNILGDEGMLRKLDWSSENGAMIWGDKIRLEEGVLKLDGLGSLFIHAGVDWLKIDKYLPRCLLLNTQCVCPPEVSKQTTGDVNCDGKTNIVDYGLWRNEFTAILTNSLDKTLWLADVNCDQIIDIVDFGLWHNLWKNLNYP